MASWNDLLNKMSSIAMGYTSGLMNPVTPVVTTISNLPKISIQKTTQGLSSISRPVISGVSSNLSRINSIKTFPIIENLTSSALMIPGNFVIGASTSLVRPILTRGDYIKKIAKTPDASTSRSGLNMIQNRTITPIQNLTISKSALGSLGNVTNKTNTTVWGNITPITNTSGYYNTTPLGKQNTLPTLIVTPSTLYKPSGSLMSLGTNKWGSASSVGTGYYKNTRVNNQVDYGTLYTTDKGAWYLVTPRGQVIQSGGAGSLSAMPKLQLRKQKYNRTKKASKIIYSKTKNKIKTNKKKYRGARK